nr:pyridoxal 5'-phosphate synthase glutaminase subunit PdxT [bacterium]
MIGVLALQGAFERHIEMLRSLGRTAVQVRTPAELAPCRGLIIPGGESTTLTILMEKYSLYDAIRAFAGTRPVMGTCAGAIMLSSRV